MELIRKATIINLIVVLVELWWIEPMVSVKLMMVHVIVHPRVVTRRHAVHSLYRWFFRITVRHCVLEFRDFYFTLTIDDLELSLHQDGGIKTQISKS